jgi:hypothetical protein
MHEDLEFSCAGTDESAKPTALLADTQMDASQSAKLIGPVGLADFPCVVAQSA